MEERRMTFSEHLEELRSRLIKSLIAVGIAVVFCVIFMQEIGQFVIEGPHHRALDHLRGKYPAIDFRLIAESYQAPFIAYFKLALLVALFLSSPVIAYQMWRFIGAGLYRNERRWVLYFAPLSLALFAGGCLFGYLVMIPIALIFLAQASNPGVVAPLFSVSEYLSLVILLTIVMGAVFQLPLLMVFFAKIGLASAGGYLRFWKVAVVGVFVAGAILTPPDPLSQLLMAVPMLLLYFVGVGISALVAPKPPAPGT
jgi:sec-independent protein translocase protein TatC